MAQTDASLQRAGDASSCANLFAASHLGFESIEEKHPRALFDCEVLSCGQQEVSRTRSSWVQSYVGERGPHPCSLGKGLTLAFVAALRFCLNAM